MKLTVEIPETTKAAIFNYVFDMGDGKMFLTSHALDSSDLFDGNIIVVSQGKSEQQYEKR